MGQTCRCRIAVISALLLFLVCGLCPAQDGMPVVDTLETARKTAQRGVKMETGRTLSDIETIRKIVTPLGEGDAIKLIQTLPGISTGAEGTSAIYARGGNIGHNLMSLDGVTVYGISHLLGVTSSVSSDVIGDMAFQIGGFDADRGQTLSSFINLKSVKPKTDRWHASVMTSPFLESASVEGPVLKKTGIFVTGRYSPIGLVYKSSSGALSSEKGLRNLDASVYDVYAKLYHQTRRGDELTGSFFRSYDNYNIVFGKNSDDYEMGWHNMLGAMRYIWNHSVKMRTEYGVSYNEFGSTQSTDVVYNSVLNRLKILSSLKEYSVEGKFILESERNSLKAGIQYKHSEFEPGSSTLSFSSEEKGSGYFSKTAVLWGQYEYRKANILYPKAAARINAYKSGDRPVSKSEDEPIIDIGSAPDSKPDGDMDIEPEETHKMSFVPEFSLLGEYNVLPNIKLVTTVDRTVQFHHLLEGIPLGWSMDLIVPSDDEIPYESALQGYFGVAGSFKRHRLTVGAYHKTMSNLVYYPDATAIFSTSISDWKDNVEVGKGSSYGLETYYEFSGKNLSARVSYTLSKTDRTFENVNYGISFPAKFDRRHIVNASAEYSFRKGAKARQGVSTAFTFQSGHWESWRAYSYPSITLDGEDYLLPYFKEQPNNLKMTDYIRLDIGYFRNWSSASGKINYKFQAGVYNLLNRHNPFLLMYDGDSKEMMELSLFPILPNLSFRVEF